MRTESIDYAYEGLALRGFLAVEAERAPGVLVVHDAGGLSENIKEKARRLAALGYCAFALDLFGGGATVTDGMRRIGEIASDLKRWRGLANAGLDVLAKRRECDAARLAAIGYCFGGTTVYELERSGAALRGVVGFHSGLSTTAPKSDAKAYKGRVLVCIGADDPFIKPEERVAFEEEMRNAGVDWQMHLYGGTVHSFTSREAGKRNNPAMRYSEAADKESWAAMQELFTATLMA